MDNKRYVEVDAKVIGYDKKDGFGVGNDEYGIKYEYFYNGVKYHSSTNFSSKFKNICLNSVEKIKIDIEKPNKILFSNSYNLKFFIILLIIYISVLGIICLINMNSNINYLDFSDFIVCFIISLTFKDLVQNVVNLYKKRNIKLIKVEASVIDHVIIHKYSQEGGNIREYYPIYIYNYNNKIYISKSIEEDYNKNKINDKIVIEINANNPIEIMNGMIKNTIIKILLEILCLIFVCFYKIRKVKKIAWIIKDLR